MACSDSGATSSFVSSAHRGLALPGSIRRLSKPLGVKTGHSTSCAHERARFLKVVPEHDDPETGLCVAVESYLVDSFADDIHLLSEARFREAGIETTSSRSGDSYMYSVLDGMESHPYSIDDCPALCTPLVKHANGLRGIGNHSFKDFKHLKCWITGKLIDINDFKPEQVGVVSCEAPGHHSANFMHVAYNTTAPRARKRLLLLGCGLGQEASLLQTLGLEVAAFAEVGGAFTHCARLFPKAHKFLGVEHLICKLRSGLKLDNVDAVVATLPCQDVTILKDLNNYPTTKTASLFTEKQHTVAELTGITMFFNEMVLPSGSNNHNHRHVVQGFEDLGYNVRCTTACASNFGGASAHNRWFMAASKNHIPSWDFHSMGGELKAPTPICDVMLPRSATRHLEMSTSDYRINAPELVIELFRCNKDNPCAGVLPTSED